MKLMKAQQNIFIKWAVIYIDGIKGGDETQWFIQNACAEPVILFGKCKTQVLMESLANYQREQSESTSMMRE